MTQGPVPPRVPDMSGGGVRAGAAFLAAVCAGAVWAALLVAITAAMGVAHLQTALALFVATWVALVALGGPPAAIVGAILLALAKSRQIRRPASDMVVGLIAGLVGIVFVSLVFPGPLRVMEPSALIAAGIGAGVLAGWVYWRLAGRPKGRPDPAAPSV